MPLLRIEDVSAGYRGRPVLAGVSFDVAAGSITALLGTNGAGKSTLIRTVSGVLPLLSGRILLDGTDVPRLRPRDRARRIAVVPQAAVLPPAFTVAEIVLMGRTPYVPFLGREGRHDWQVAWRAMVQSDVHVLQDRRAEELSGGERQRTVIARALAQEPQVLLLDEATAHLDLRHQAALTDLVRSLARERGLAVLATLHDLNQAARFADTIAILHEGRLHALGTPEETLRPDVLEPVYGVTVEVLRHPVTGVPLVAL